MNFEIDIKSLLDSSELPYESISESIIRSPMYPIEHISHISEDIYSKLFNIGEYSHNSMPDEGNHTLSNVKKPVKTKKQRFRSNRTTAKNKSRHLILS